MEDIDCTVIQIPLFSSGRLVYPCDVSMAVILY